MTREEAVNWLTNIMSDIGKIEHQDLWHYEQALSEIREFLSAQPERKTGRWYDIGSLSCRCSACGCKSQKESKFCPNCGADMRGESDD